ncbi:hypothetical protein CEXT_569451 [Caerostris extrusa]|uniref:Ycf15 n=1 Tax=Caerostris extrusa TaxID=172846 RepID=A0AAV4X2F8_CAEEX|nr:hypothetical protein CEXT_569451 [Caerostris extrusa]
MDVQINKPLQSKIEPSHHSHTGISALLLRVELWLVGNNGVAFTRRMALPEVKNRDVVHPFFPGTPPCHDEATNRLNGFPPLHCFRNLFHS